MVLVLLAIIHAKNWYTISKATEKEKKKSSTGIPTKDRTHHPAVFLEASTLYEQFVFAGKEHMEGKL